MMFNGYFADNTILSFFFFFFWIIVLYFVIPLAITQTLNPLAELAIPTGIWTKEAKVEMDTHPVTIKTK